MQGMAMQFKSEPMTCVKKVTMRLSCLLASSGSKQSAECRNVRTSQGTFISSQEDGEGVLAWIENRLAQLTGLPADHGEVRLLSMQTMWYTQPQQQSNDMGNICCLLSYRLLLAIALLLLSTVMS